MFRYNNLLCYWSRVCVSHPDRYPGGGRDTETLTTVGVTVRPTAPSDPGAMPKTATEKREPPCYVRELQIYDFNPERREMRISSALNHTTRPFVKIKLLRHGNLLPITQPSLNAQCSIKNPPPTSPPTLADSLVISI